jgi:hypothetical protein
LTYLLLVAAAQEALPRFPRRVLGVEVRAGIEPLPAFPYLLGPLTRSQLGAAVRPQVIPEEAEATLQRSRIHPQGAVVVEQMAQRAALVAAALNQARVAQVIRHLPLPRRDATGVTARLLALDKGAQEVAALLMLEQTMLPLRAGLAVMAQFGLMVFHIVAVAVAVMAIQVLALAALAALAAVVLAMGTALQHPQRRELQTEVVAVAVQDHLVGVLLAAQGSLFSVTLIRSLLPHPPQDHQQLLFLVGIGITRSLAPAQSRFKSWHSSHHKQTQTAFGRSRRSSGFCRVATTPRSPMRQR